MIVLRRFEQLVLSTAVLVVCACAETRAADPNTSSQAEAQTTQPAQLTELRAAWLTGGEILKPSFDLQQHYQDLRKSNLNVVMVNAIYSGLAAYPNSQFLPIHPGYIGRPDVLRQAIQQIDKTGMGVYLLSGDGFIAHKIQPNHTSGRGPYLTAHPELMQTDSSGSTLLKTTKDSFAALCPSNPASHEFLAGLFAEAVLRYKPSGFVMYNFHYWSKDHCFCGYCREHFENDTGIALGVFDPKSTESRAWTSWKRKQLAIGMATISKGVRSARPGITLMAYGLTKRDRDEKSQPWETWLKDGSLDYVILSLRDQDIRPALDAVLRMKGVRPSQLIAGLFGGQPSVDLLRNVELARNKGLAGQAISGSRDLKNDDLFGLMDGPYAQPASPPQPRKAKPVKANR